MIKFVISGERIAECCNITDYLLLSVGNVETVARVIPRFVLNDKGEFIVKVVLDEDGDIAKFENMTDALMKISGVTPKRLEKLTGEFMEAVKNIVNPPNARA